MSKALPVRFESLKACLVDLESHLAAGSLTDDHAEAAGEAGGEELLRVYRNLSDRGLRPQGNFRRDSVNELLAAAGDLLRTERTFPAEPLPAASSWHPAQVGEGEAKKIMQRHHMLSMRYWGSAPAFADKTLQLAYEKEVWVSVTKRLAADLSGLEKIEAWLVQKSKLKGSTKVLPKDQGSDFERLVIDILDELSRVARRAPLHEDYLEKTDLRVSYKNLDRSRGARVQVTATTDPRRLEQKLSRMTKPGEFVLFSPRPMVEAVLAKRFLDVDTAKFWDCFPNKPAFVEEAAAMMKTMMTDAIKRKGEHPWGPAGFIPAPVRDIVQQYVQQEAAETTRQMKLH